jgi:pyruvate,water dikinase
VSKGKGNVKGKVRVLMSSQNVSAIKKGEILVAPMTSPEYIIAMRKAKAIITDVGGLMSHAAVISRELDIPCIVGTKYATQLLKTGDVVELLVESGEVKKQG